MATFSAVLGDISPYIFIPLLLSLVDFITIIRSRFYKAESVSSETKDCRSFTILIPIFGNMRYLKNVGFLSQYPGQVILCTTTKETSEFYSQIESIAQRFNFSVYRSRVPIASSKHKPNPWRLFSNTLTGGRESADNVEKHILSEEARDEIIREGSQSVKTEYSIFIDGDTVTDQSLGKLTGLMKQKEFDLSSVRVLASKQDTIMEKLQSVEYEFAMDARKIYPWLTSGAAMIAKTHIIREIMKHHSLFFSGGDIEIGKLAKILGFNVGHIAFPFYTDVPETFRAWFKQRMAWFGGGFRHAVINMHKYSWKHPMHFFYFTVLVYLLAPVRWYEVVRHPLVLLLVILIYWVLIFLFHWKRLRYFYILFPFYALIQIMILVPLGVYTYFKMALASQNTGAIKLRNLD